MSFILLERVNNGIIRRLGLPNNYRFKIFKLIIKDINRITMRELWAKYVELKEESWFETRFKIVQSSIEVFFICIVRCKPHK